MASQALPRRRLRRIGELNVSSHGRALRQIVYYQLYEAKDMFAPDGVIDVVGRDRQLPEQFWLSKRLFAWSGWSRSGIWQYYETISQEDFEAIASALERFGLRKLAVRYRSGMESWKQLGGCDELDRWVDTHQAELESTAFELIAYDRYYLYDES